MTAGFTGEHARQHVLIAVLLAIGVGLLLAGAGGLALAEENDDITHEHPDEAGGDGDLAEIADWLGALLGGNLGDSASQVEQGDYERAAELLGEGYDERLADYIGIEGDTGRESDPRATDELEKTRQLQEEYIALIKEFDETLAAYDEAIEKGNEQEARQLLRELERIADEVSAIVEELDGAYDELDGLVPADFEEARESNQRTASQTNETVQSRDELEFEETVITATAANPVVSPIDPVTINGTVETADGEPVVNGTVQVAIGDEVTTGEVLENGTFAVDALAGNTTIHEDTAEVTYQPDPTSAYRESATNVSISVRQVSGTITITDTPDTVSFNDTLTVAGQLDVEGEPVGGIPITLWIDNQRIAHTVTESNGSFVASEPLGLRPATGETEVIVTVGRSDLAVGPTDALQTITIDETETDLALETTDVTATQATVTAELETNTGTAVSDQWIRFSVDGEPVAMEETDGNGTVEAIIPLSSDDDAESVVIEAVYDGEGTNLASSEADATIALGGSGPASMLRYFGIGLIGLLGLFLAGFVVYRHQLVDRGLPAPWIARLRGQNQSQTADNSEESMSQVTPDTVGLNEVDGRAVSLLDAARDRHERGITEEAIELAYLAGRRAVGNQVENGEEATHWEFYQACRDTSVPALERIAELTRSYEAAAFAPSSPSATTAERAIDAATRIIDTRRSDVPGID